MTDNCRLLSGLAPEVGLVLFESRACLDYGEDDLSPDMATLPLTYHVHLPLDLPWRAGPNAAFDTVQALVDKTAYLAPWGFVLHPPQTVAELAAFVRLWVARGLDPAALMLENVDDNDLSTLLGPSADMGLSLCLDLGHLLAYNQQIPTLAQDWARMRMLHLYAPGPGARHTPLAGLDDKGKTALRGMLERVRPDTVLMLEVFETAGLFASAELLATWMEQWNLEH